MIGQLAFPPNGLVQPVAMDLVEEFLELTRNAPWFHMFNFVRYMMGTKNLYIIDITQLQTPGQCIYGGTTILCYQKAIPTQITSESMAAFQSNDSTT